MTSALIVSSSDEMLENISLVSKEYGIDSISISDGVDTRTLFEHNTYDVVILNLPLKTEAGLELIAYISKKTQSSIIVLVPQKLYDEAYKKIGFTGAYILARPVNKQIIIQALRFVMNVRSKEAELNNAISDLENKLHDAKLIDRAKCVLIQYLRITEAEAHRQIQKRAMDQRASLASVAQDILRTYEM